LILPNVTLRISFSRKTLIFPTGKSAMTREY
jgi:hypothetical protein